MQDVAVNQAAEPDVHKKVILPPIINNNNAQTKKTTTKNIYFGLLFPSAGSDKLWHTRVILRGHFWFVCWKTPAWLFSRCPSNGIKDWREPPDRRQHSISLSLQTDLALQSSSYRGLGNHSNYLEKMVCSHPAFQHTPNIRQSTFVWVVYFNAWIHK